MHCSVGLGLNPFLAKVAAELQKPNGLGVIAEDDLPHKLYRMELTDFPGISKGMESRFHAAGVFNTEHMYALTLDQMRRVWGGVQGERWWHQIRGHEVALPPTIRRSIGHSHVLPPELGDCWKRRRSGCGIWGIRRGACRSMRGPKMAGLGPPSGV